MNFIVDAQLPPAFADWLSIRGHHASHVRDFGLEDASDRVIWDHAIATNCAIITKDEDFARRSSVTTGGPVIVWLRVGNATKRQLFAWIEPRWTAVAQLLADGNRLIEVR